MSERDSATPVYGIAVAAELAEMNAASLRLLEQKGLLTPARSDGGTRRYSDDDVARLQRVARLRDEGMNIAGIGRVLALEDENAGLRGELEAERAESEALRRREAERG
ncbi:MerR family transcriptional regulator [Microbacterium azadirachtae]|uniref:MerR family transcriptional regulator n=1 Tax=Microbacterium azadirachtae TaxID=582680 RepID=UPI00087F5C46|nr:MerR family transcriptional regulator [Microbacterium azadirachtae]SDM15084.1 MerR family transcriptional regulator, heat shock protein HspR [Microbacterium azadirachtae]SEG38764.1 MerR family transcriptional regulator, heat shock protein HspR [Microbacterium azadirachtae]SEG41783.1 MerR family transcriptional regulator, heat shock protein HspR [Microbacterium azadirachtae]